MSAIHYKFSSSNEYKNVTFDGLSISLFDLKRAIMEKQKLKSTELDLHITNAQTLQVYKDETVLIPKNTAVLVRRIPLGPVRDSKVYIVKRSDTSSYSIPTSQKSVQESDAQPKLSFDELTKASNLAEANATEEDKIKAAIHQSTNDYDPSKFYKPPKYGSYKYNASTTTPAQSATGFVRCFRCNQHGHYAMQCPLPKSEMEKAKMIRHATGIPRSHMVEVKKDSKGAMLTTDGRYVVPAMDKKGYDVGKKEKPPFLPVDIKPVEEEEEDEPIPDELICLLCKDLLVDAVVIPCCGNSYCDDCIRNALLDSDTHQCPTCHKENISPDSLIANKFLRQAVNKFKNDTGIAKKRSNAPVWPRPAPSEKPKMKAVPALPTKVTYGQVKKDYDKGPVSGAYVVKAKSDQIIASRPYTVARRAQEGGSSPHDPNQPIRIKLGPSENGNEAASAATVTPVASQPQAQSTPQETPSLPSSTPQSETYTFNSTPDTGEEKPKVIGIEPVPPGTSPPVAKVVRPLMEIKTEPGSSAPASVSLSGIHPLATTNTAPLKSQSPVPTLTTETSISAGTSPNAQPHTTNHSDLVTSIQPTYSNVNNPVPQTISSNEQVMSALPLPTVVNPPNSAGLGLLGEAPTPAPAPVSLAPVTVRPAPTPSSAPPSNPVNITLPALKKPVPTVHAPITIPPPIIPPGLPAGLPPGLVGIPPPNIPTSGVNLFQHPPPPFPFNLLPPPPGFPMPPVSGLQIPPSLANVPPPGFPLPTSLNNRTSTATVSSTTTSNRAPPRRARTPPRRRSPSRSPRKRLERKSRKSKLDIMSDEFAEKMSKKRYSRRGRRSRSASYTSGSYSSSSYSSSSRSSSSYSDSYTGSSWSSSSYSSESRSPSPRHRKKKRKTKELRGSRRKSPTPEQRNAKRSSRHRRRSNSRKREDPRRRKMSTSGDRKRKRSRTPSPRRERRRSPRRVARELSRSPRPNNRQEMHAQITNPAYPAIPVIGGAGAYIPGLPSKEQADFERDQALYAHYRQAYERDWYERGVMPPSPYNRFIQPRFSRSPSPPGTGSRILPPPDGRPPPWESQGRHVNPSALPAAERYELQNNILREEQYYDGVQARLTAMAQQNDDPAALYHDNRTRRSPRRRYEDDRARRRDQGRSRERAPDGRYGDDRRRDRGKSDRDAKGDGRYQESRDARGRDASQRNDNFVEGEGDATPVRDERPPPEEYIDRKEEKAAAPRRAGDTLLSGSSRRSKSDKSASSKGQAESKGANRSDSKSRKDKDKKRSDSKSKTAESRNRSDGRAKKEEEKSRSDSRSKRDDSKKRPDDRQRKSGDARPTKKESSRRNESAAFAESSRKSDRRREPKKTEERPEKERSGVIPETEKEELAARNAEAGEKDVRKTIGPKRTITVKLQSLAEEGDKKDTSPSTWRNIENATLLKESETPAAESPESATDAVTAESSLPEQMETLTSSQPPDFRNESESQQNKHAANSIENQNIGVAESSNLATDTMEGKIPENKVDEDTTRIQNDGKGHSPNTDMSEHTNHDTERPATENYSDPKTTPKMKSSPTHEMSKDVGNNAEEGSRETAEDTRKMEATSMEGAQQEQRSTPDAKRREGENDIDIDTDQVHSSKSEKALRRERRKERKQKKAERRKRTSNDHDTRHVTSTTSSKQQRKKKPVEYDGSAPPPTGDEIIKITIPKSRWEESDEEANALKKPESSHDASEKESSTVKPSAIKGRRIKIKRKPPVEEQAQPPTLEKPEIDRPAKAEVVNAAPPQANNSSSSSKVPDARMVITLRRNSKRDEDLRLRKVSLEEPDEASFKPDYNNDDSSNTNNAFEESDPKSGADKSSLVSVKGKSIKVTAMRSSRQDSYVSDDVIDLAHPSGLSDDLAASEGERVESHKAAKKKKKKKKKRKNRYRSGEDDVEPISEQKTTEQEGSITPEEEQRAPPAHREHRDSFRVVERKDSSKQRSQHHKRARDPSAERSVRQKRQRRERSATPSDLDVSPVRRNHHHRSRERPEHHRDRKQHQQGQERHRHHGGTSKRERHGKRKSKRRHRGGNGESDFSSSYEEEANFKRSRRVVA